MKYYKQLEVDVPLMGDSIEAHMRYINPPLIEKELDEADIMMCLRQNGWKKHSRKYKGKTRIYLTKDT
jgi:hypothetical protein